MRIPEKQLRTAELGYLYENGKLVLIHRQPHKHAGQVEWATVHDVSTVQRWFRGRIVLHNRGALRLILGARIVRAKAPTLEQGSDNTKRLGIAYGYVSVTLGADEYRDSVHFPVFDSFVSGDFTCQPENEWVEITGTHWGSYPLAAT